MSEASQFVREFPPERIDPEGWKIRQVSSTTMPEAIVRSTRLVCVTATAIFCLSQSIQLVALAEYLTKVKPAAGPQQLQPKPQFRIEPQPRPESFRFLQS